MLQLQSLIQHLYQIRFDIIHIPCLLLKWVLLLIS
jgi:hypothetical protein